MSTDELHERIYAPYGSVNRFATRACSRIATELVGLAHSQMKMSAVHCSGLDFSEGTAYGNGQRRGRRRWSKE